MSFWIYTRVALLTLFGGYISYKDFKQRKIYNRDILIMLFVGVVTYLMYSNFQNLLNYTLNFIITLAISITLWKTKLWGAGDGKLFAVCSLYFPVKFYESMFPSQILMFNFFVMAFFIWLPSMITKTNRKDKLNAIKNALKPEIVINLALTIFGLMWLIGKFLSQVGASIYVFDLVVAMLLYYFISTTFQKKTKYILIVLAIPRLFLDVSLFKLATIINFLLSILIISLAYGIGMLGINISYETRPLSKVKESDIPMGLMRKKSKKDVNFTKFMKKWFGTERDRIIKNGFSEEDLKNKSKMKDEIDGFVVKKYVPFAPLFFIATLVTIALNQDIITYIIIEFYAWLFA